MQLEELRAFKPQILEIAARYGINSDIRVFGSVARGEATKDSDVDLLIEWNQPNFDNYLGFKEECTKVIGSPIDLVEEKFIRNPLRRKYILQDAVDL